MKFINSATFANSLDKADPLKAFRNEFHIPKVNGRPSLYFTGNSLGLEPVAAKEYLLEELKDWAQLGVEGHFHAKRPWLNYHKLSQAALSKIVGAKTFGGDFDESTHYQPSFDDDDLLSSDKEKYKVIAEAGAFSSDQYAFESQLKLHGLNPDDALIEVSPRSGEFTLRTEDILEAIKTHGDEVALVIFGAVQYYTGQFFDIEKITAAAHQVGAYAGFDLAHAIGNVSLKLHKDEVDFAVWCSYKYLNAGPGAVAGAFVHEKHGNNPDFNRLAGWWGHDESERFQMKKGFRPMTGAEGWQVSNFPVFAGTAQLASLEIFKRAGMAALRRKSLLLTGYLEFLLKEIASDAFTIITPSSPEQRGCQLSILMNRNGRKVFKMLAKNGVVADWREPNVIRVAPVPLYNKFSDVFVFVQLFRKALSLK